MTPSLILHSQSELYALFFNAMPAYERVQGPPTTSLEKKKKSCGKHSIKTAVTLRYLGHQVTDRVKWAYEDLILIAGASTESNQKSRTVADFVMSAKIYALFFSYFFFIG